MNADLRAMQLAGIATRFQNAASTEFDGSPLYQALCQVVADNQELLELVAVSGPRQDPPNLFFASVHYLLLDGADHPLCDFFPSLVDSPARPEDAAPALVDFCERYRPAIEELLRDRHVQTNVVKRAAALRYGLFSLVDLEVPLHLIEVGASGGLLLSHDRYRYQLNDVQSGDVNSEVEIKVDWVGPEPLPDLDRQPVIGSRLGVDLHPPDLAMPAGRRWLRALVWPENGDERTTLDHAIDTAVLDPPVIRQGNIVDLAPVLDDELPDDEPRVVFHAATFVHVPVSERLAFTEAIDLLGRTAPLYVISLEPPLHDDPAATRNGPCHALRVRRPDTDDQMLGLVEGHGAWIEPVTQ